MIIIEGKESEDKKVSNGKKDSSELILTIGINMFASTLQAKIQQEMTFDPMDPKNSKKLDF